MSLTGQAEIFADQISGLLSSMLTVEIRIGSLVRADRVVVSALDSKGDLSRIPLCVGGKRVAELTAHFFLVLDRGGRYLKAERTDFVVHSVLDRQPLVRLDFRSDMHTAPVSHWQIHAERGAFSSMLTMAHSIDADRVEKPHMLSSLHLPLGGERLRPCLEDMLEFLIRECGIDAKPGWEAAVSAGRQVWRAMQIRTIALRHQVAVAEALKAEGWKIEAPDTLPIDSDDDLQRW